MRSPRTPIRTRQARSTLPLLLALLVAGCSPDFSTFDPNAPRPPDDDGDASTGTPTDDGGPADDGTRSTDGGGDRDDGDTSPSGLPSCFDPAFAPGEGSGEGADVDQSCEVTAECREPLICVEGICVAPGAEGTWCDGIDIICPNDGSTCIAGLCVFADGNCAQNVDCPSGYECVEGECRPESGECVVDGDCGDGRICDFGTCLGSAECATTADLRGGWEAESLMHLGEASEGVVGAILSATEWIRDILQGRGGIPGFEFLDDIVYELVTSNLYDYQIDAIIALGDVSDLLDEVRITHDMTLDAECREIYRGTLTFERVQVQFRGETISEAPENIPRVGPIEPAEFGAVLRCRSLAIDEFRVDHLVGGLIRWVTDLVIQHASEGAYDHIEQALVDVINCEAIGDGVGDDWLGVAVTEACELAMSEAVEEVTSALDETAFDMGLMRIEGAASVPSERVLEDGRWTGSVLTGDFTGEFSARRR